MAQDPVNHLRIKLYKSLHAKGASEYARVITTADAQRILECNGVQNASIVKRLIPPKSNYGPVSSYSVELYVDSKTASTESSCSNP
mmetsp:Transcript_36310/g.58158  ORF Transcript_36310/g.58158 Transcript_36310/m.58158 type:complete len:86 (-) Transcript_36310:306-563(-)